MSNEHIKIFKKYSEQIVNTLEELSTYNVKNDKWPWKDQIDAPKQYAMRLLELHSDLEVACDTLEELSKSIRTIIKNDKNVQKFMKSVTKN